MAEGKRTIVKESGDVEIEIFFTHVKRHFARVSEDGKFGGFDFYSACFEIGVDVVFGSFFDQTFDLDDVFRTQGFGGCGNFSPEDDLGETTTIAQINKNNFAVIAFGVDPTLEGDGLSNFVDGVFDKCAFHVNLLYSSLRIDIGGYSSTIGR